MAHRAAISWSGGKDSYLALLRACGASARQASTQYDVVAMVTMFTEDGARSRSHGLRPELLAAQAQCLGLELVAGHGSWETYEAGYRDALVRTRALGVTHVIFGDIMPDSSRAFPERVCAAEGLTCVEPIFGEPTSALYREFVATGADARIVTIRESALDASWLGRRLTLELLAELESMGVDPCGEYGEYHTVVLDAPRFSSAIAVDFGERVRRGDCWAVDLTCGRRDPTADGPAPPFAPGASVGPAEAIAETHAARR